MRGDEPPHAVEGEVRGSGPQHAVEVGGQRGMQPLGLGQAVRVGRCLAEDQPGGGPVIHVGRLDHRPVRIDRPVAHLLHPRVHLHQGLGHVGAHGELERDRAARVGALAGQLHEPFHAAQLLLERLDKFPLHLLRAGAAPAGFHGDRGNLHLRGQLHRHGDQCEAAEQDQQQDADGDFHRVGDAGRDQVHGRSCRAGRSVSRQLERHGHPGP